MERCVRCGNAVEQLHPLPVDSLTPEARERVGGNGGNGGTGGTQAGMACLMCRNEVLEG